MQLFAKNLIFILLSFRKYSLNFTLAATKCTKIWIKAKQANYLSLMRGIRGGIRSTKRFYRNIMNRIVYRISKCFWKESFYGMVCYTMLCYATLWYDMESMESMVCYKISMQCYEISLLCYTMDYVVKYKHSATVLAFHK